MMKRPFGIAVVAGLSIFSAGSLLMPRSATAKVKADLVEIANDFLKVQVVNDASTPVPVSVAPAAISTLHFRLHANVGGLINTTDKRILIEHLNCYADVGSNAIALALTISNGNAPLPRQFHFALPPPPPNSTTSVTFVNELTRVYVEPGESVGIVVETNPPQSKGDPSDFVACQVESQYLP